MAKVRVGIATESHLCLGAVVQVSRTDAAVATARTHKICQQFLHCISNSHFFQVALGGLKRGEREREGERARWPARLRCSHYLISSSGSGRVFGYLWRRGSACCGRSGGGGGRLRLLRGLAAWREGGRAMVFFLLQSVGRWSSLVRFCRLPASVRPSTRPPASPPAYARTHTLILQVFFTYFSS